MSLATRSEELRLGDYLTIEQAARVKGSSYHALRMYLRSNATIPIKRIGDVIIVRLQDIESYTPRGVSK